MHVRPGPNLEHHFANKAELRAALRADVESIIQSIFNSLGLQVDYELVDSPYLEESRAVPSMYISSNVSEFLQRLDTVFTLHGMSTIRYPRYSANGHGAGFENCRYLEVSYRENRHRTVSSF